MFWLVALGVGDLAACFATLASIIHFQIIGALGFFAVTAACWFVRRDYAADGNGGSWLMGDQMVPIAIVTFGAILISPSFFLLTFDSGVAAAGLGIAISIAELSSRTPRSTSACSTLVGGAYRAREFLISASRARSRSLEEAQEKAGHGEV